MKIVNPYENVDFNSARRVLSFSHEHTYDKVTNEKAYNRGVRCFASMHYMPCAPRFPLSSFSYEYQDWNYIDISSYSPTGGTGGTDIYTTVNARKKVPTSDGFRQQYLIIAYKESENARSYTKLTVNPNGENWNNLCEDESKWVTLNEEEMEQQLSLCTRVIEGSVPTLTDSEGNTINTDDLPQIQNSSEHTLWKFSDNSTLMGHFNVLGSSYAEPAWGVGIPQNFRIAHPIHTSDEINSIFLNPANQQFGKIYGTINHPNAGVRYIKKVLNIAPNVFKAMEVFNCGFNTSMNNEFLSMYDRILTDGYKINLTAVVDWSILVADERAKFPRGYNVLLHGAEYDNLPTNCFVKSSSPNYVYSKGEACLDAYIAGRYYASGRGVHYITDLTVSGRNVTISFDANASVIKAITNKGKTETSGGSMSFTIPKGATYLRFEAYWNEKPEGFDDMTEIQQEEYAKTGVMDFIFTNPMWIEDEDNTDLKQKMLLLII